MILHLLRRHWHRIVDCDQNEHDYQGIDIQSTVRVKARTPETELGGQIVAVFGGESWCRWCGQPELLEAESAYLGLVATDRFTPIPDYNEWGLT